MSYDVRLVDPETKEVLVSKTHRQEGGTQVMGGTSECDLNITYNYGSLYHLALLPEKATDPALEEEGLIYWLAGRQGKDTEAMLRLAHERLGSPTRPDYGRSHGPSCDYWTPTPENAGWALVPLIEWASEHPEGVWVVG